MLGPWDRLGVEAPVHGLERGEVRVGNLAIGDNQEIDVAVAIEVANGERPLQAGRVEIGTQNRGGAPGQVCQYLIELWERRWLTMGRPTHGCPPRFDEARS